MITQAFMVGGLILLGVLIALTNALKWPQWMYYLWAAMVIVFSVAMYVAMYLII